MDVVCMLVKMETEAYPLYWKGNGAAAAHSRSGSSICPDKLQHGYTFLEESVHKVVLAER
jgi:hypothetical protein